MRFQQLLGLLQRIDNTVSKIFSSLGESGEKCGVQFLMKTVFSEACCPILGAMEPLPVLPASSLHWIVSVPQLDPCLEVDIQQF